MFKKQNARKGIKTVQLTLLFSKPHEQLFKKQNARKGIKTYEELMLAMDATTLLKFKKQNARKGIKTDYLVTIPVIIT